MTTHSKETSVMWQLLANQLRRREVIPTVPLLLNYGVVDKHRTLLYDCVHYKTAVVSA